MTRRAMIFLAALAMLATMAGVAPSPAGVALQAECVSPPQEVLAVGTACRTADGLWGATLEDGFSITTHGPDPVPIHGMLEMLRVRGRNPSCVSDPRSMYHIQILYTTTSDKPDRFSQRISYIQRMIERINGMLYKEGAEFGRPMVYRMACVRGRVSVKNAGKLAVPSGPNQGVLRPVDPINFINIVTDIRRKGYTNPLAKYWVFVDAPPPFPELGGVASFINDDRLIAENASNFGPGYGLFWDVGEAFTTEAMMHEASHLQGAIVNSAPHSTAQYGGGAHCIDDSDVMCYPDAQGVLSVFQIDRCRKLHFDCGHDDYFNPRPSSRNFLATHWNLGSPLNRFFAGCSYQTGKLTAGVPAPEEAGDTLAPVQGAVGSTRTLTIPRACRGRPFALTGAISPQPREVDPIVGLVPDTHLALALVGSGPPDHVINNRRCTATPSACVTPGPDFNVCFYRGSKRLSCFNQLGTERGTVPKTATKAVVSFNLGVQGIWILSIV